MICIKIFTAIKNLTNISEINTVIKNNFNLSEIKKDNKIVECIKKTEIERRKEKTFSVRFIVDQLDRVDPNNRVCSQVAEGFFANFLDKMTDINTMDDIYLLFGSIKSSEQARIALSLHRKSIF